MKCSKLIIIIITIIIALSLYMAQHMRLAVSVGTVETGLVHSIVI